MSEPSTTQAVAPGADYVLVARSGQLPENYVRRFYARGLELCVARYQGRAYATSNYCTHLDCLLSSGRLVDDGIGCSCHGSVFDPATGEAIYPPATRPIATYPVEEIDGQIWVRVTDEDIAAGGPRRRHAPEQQDAESGASGEAAERGTP